MIAELSLFLTIAELSLFVSWCPGYRRAIAAAGVAQQTREAAGEAFLRGLAYAWNAAAVRRITTQDPEEPGEDRAPSPSMPDLVSSSSSDDG